MAISYSRLNQMDSAEKYYLQVINTGFHEIIDLYEYAEVLKVNGKYDEAFHWLAVYSEKRPHDSRVLRQFADPESYNRIIQDTANFELKFLKANTPQQDFGPVRYGESIVFTSSRPQTAPIKREWNWTGTPYLDLFTAEVDSLGDFIDVQALEGPFNSKYHDGPIAFNEAGDLAVFTRNVGSDEGDEGALNFQLFFSKKVDGKWTKPEGMWFNHPNYSVGHPTLSADGKVLYFSSDMPGGFGKSDLYMVKARAEKGWGFPINLGRDVNTEGQEMFPYLHTKDSLLYFSSNGHPGIGGLDLFVGSVDGSHLKYITNIGLPFNSNRDDFGMLVSDDRTNGYFSSNRSGGAGSDDIIRFTERERIDSILYHDPLNVHSAELGDFEYAEGQGDLRGKFVSRKVAQDSVLLNLYNEDGDLIGAATTDEDGKFVFKGLNFYDSYIVKLSEEGEGLFDQSTIYFLDQEGNKVDSARTLLFNAYSFQYLPKEYAVRPAIDEFDESDLTVVGQFSYKGLATGPMNLEILDEQDIRDTVLTDSLGLFTFDKLRANEEYLVRVLDDDTMDMQFASIEFISSDSGVVGFAKKTEDGSFAFTASKEIAFDNAELFRGKRSQFVGKFVIDEQGKDGVVISLFDQDGEFISTTTTDSTGEFIFEDVEYFREYKLRLAEAYSDLFNGSKIYLLDEYREPKDTAAVYRFNEFTFIHLPKDVAMPLDLIEEKDESWSLSGFFTDRNDPKEGVKLYLIDEDGLEPDSTTTAVNGEFEFQELKVNTDYTLSINDSTLATIDSARVYLINEAYPEGEEVHLNNGRITLNSSRFGVRLSSDEDPEMGKVEMKGVFLHQDILLADVRLLIFNENGVRVGEATTDSLGEFIFEGLEHCKPYTIRLSKEYIGLFEESTLYIRDTRYHISDTASMRNFNEYRFILLPPIHIPSIERIVEKDVPFDLRSSASGQFRYTTLPDGAVRFYLVDQEGVTIDTLHVSKSGRFDIHGLKEGQTYFLRVDDKDTALLSDATWSIFDSDSEKELKSWRVGADIIAFMAPSIWVSPIVSAMSEGNDSVKTVVEEVRIAHPDLRPIYFAFGESTIGEKELSELDRVIDFLKRHPKLSIEVRSFTDSKGAEEFNLKLSEARAKASIDYIVRKGIDRSRIQGKGYGEAGLLNGCFDGVDCSDEEHAINRRTEFYITE